MRYTMMSTAKMTEEIMTLTEYMKLYRKTDSWIAEKVGYDRSHINRIRRGAASPSVRLIRLIADATKNKVTFQDWENVNG